MYLDEVLAVVRLNDVGQCLHDNEDAIASDIDIGLVVSPDSVGGYKAGGVASEIAVLSISTELKDAMLSHAPSKLDSLFGMQAVSHL